MLKFLPPMFRRTHRASRRLIAALCVPALAVAVATCTDSGNGPFGPRGSGPAQLSVAPTFSATASLAVGTYKLAGLEYDRVRVILIRPPSDTVKDTTVTFSPTQPDLSLPLQVTALPGEELSVTLRYQAGTLVLFSGTAVVKTTPLNAPSLAPTPIPVFPPDEIGGKATAVTVSPATGSFPTTAPVTFSATAKGSDGAAIPGAVFGWNVDDATIGTVSTTGVVQPTTKGGVLHVRATAVNQVFGEATITFVAPPVAINLVSGGSQSAAAGSALTQIVVKVSDANGNGVAGETVVFAVATGGGSIVVNNGTTDANGLARVTWTLGSTAGTQTITATRAGLTGSPITISATATPGAAASLSFQVQPTTTVAGAIVTPSVTVRALDALGNLVTGFTGSVTVAIVANPGSSTLGGTVSRAAIGGVATFNDLTLNNAGTGYTLGATATSLTAATSAAFNVTVGSAALLAFQVQPSTTVAGVVMSPSVTVRALDGSGNLVTGFTGSVTIAIGTNPGSATLGGTVTRAAVAGVATFNDLTLSAAGTGYTLAGSAAGLIGVTSTAFNVTAAPATALEFIVQPTNTTQGTSITPAVQVRIVNGVGALVTTATNSITLAIGANPGSGTLAGTLTVAASGGIASFSGLSINNVGTAYTLTASTSGLTGATSATFDILASAAPLKTWTGATSAAWTTAGNWSPSGAPGAADSVVIPSGTTFAPTLSANVGVRAVVVQSGATLAVGGISLTTSPGKITNQGTITFTSSGIAGAVHNQGTIIVQGSASIGGALTTAAGSMFRVQGNSTGGTALSTITNGFTNNGAIELTDAGGFSATMTVSAGTLVNAAGATITTIQGSGGTRNLFAELNNQGTLTLGGTQGLTISKAGASHTNSGTIAITSGNLALTQSGTTPSFTNTGTVSMASSRLWTVNGGSLELTGGTVSGASATLNLAGVAVNLTTASVTTFLQTDAATTVVGGTITIPSGQTLNLITSTLGANVDVQGGGTFVAHRVVSLTGALTTAATATVRANGNGGTGAFTVAGGFTNNGLLEMTDAGGFGSTLTVTSGTLVNSATGIINPLAGSGGGRTLAAQLNNQGTITLANSQGLTLAKASAAHTNSGTIALTNGNLAVTQTGTTPSFTNTGAVAVGSSRIWFVTGGALNIASGTTIGGTLDITGVAIDFTTASMTSFLSTDVTTTVVGGTVTIPTSQTFNLISATLGANVTVQTGGTFVANRGVGLNGALTTATGATVRAHANGGTGSFVLANGFTNNGLLEITDAGGFGATLTVTTGTLFNASTGTIAPLGGSGGGRTLAAVLDNQGTITLGNSQGLTLTKASAAHTNSGTINLSVGNLTVTQTGTTPSFTNTGTVTIGTSNTWSVTGGALNVQTGTTSGGTLNVTGVTLNLTTATMTSFLQTDASTTIVGGTITIPGGQALNLITSTLGANVDVQNLGTFVAHRSVSLTGALTTVAGATVRAHANGGTGAFTVANGFTNNGLLEITDAGGFGATLTVTTGTLVNAATGTITPLGGSGGGRTLAALLNNQGTITLGNSQGLTLTKASAAHTNSGTINLSVGNLAVTQTGTSPSFTNTGTVTIGSSNTWSVNGGALNVQGGTTSGGTLSVTGVTLNLTTATMTSFLQTDAATTIVGGTITIPSGQALNLITSTLGANVDVQSGGTFVAHRAVSLTGALTTAATSTVRAHANGGTGAFTVANGFTNNGLLEITDAGGFGSTLTVTTGTLINAPGATITPLGGSGGGRTLAAVLDNQGTVTLGNSQGLTLSKASAAHTNSGSINLSVGNLAVTQTGTSPSFTNTGTVTIGSSNTWSVNGGALNVQAGTTSGGTLSLTGVTVNLTTGTMTSFLQTDAATTVVGGTITIPSGQALNLITSTLGANVDVQSGGTFVAHRAVSLTGALTTAATSTVRAHGNGGTGAFTVANGFTNNGLIEITDAGGFGATMTVTNGTLINAVGATIAPATGSGGGRTLAAQLDNQGTLTLGNSQGLTLTKASAAHTNSGTINLSVGNLAVTQTGTTPSFTNTGTVTIGANNTWTVTGGALNLQSGTTSGSSGTLSLVGAAVNLTTAAVTTFLTTDAATTVVGGTITVPNGQTLNLINSTLSANVDVQGGGTFVAHRAVSLTGALTTASGATVRAHGNGGTGSFTVANGFTNNGLIEITDLGGFSATLTVTNGTLTNGVGATISPLSGSGGSRFLVAEVNNQGTITLGDNQGLILTKAGAAHTNSGTITQTVSGLTVTQTGTSPSFTNTGSITVGFGTSWTVTGGALNLTSGTVTGAGPVSFSGLTLDLTPANVTNALILTSVAFANPVTIGASQQLNILSGTLAANVTVQALGTLLITGTANMTGTLAMPSSNSVLRMQGSTGVGPLTFTLANGFTNNGTIELTTASNAPVTFVVSSGTLTNAVGGTILISQGLGGNRAITAELNNAGTVTVLAGSGLTVAKPSGLATANHINSGTFTLGPSAGTFTLTQTGTSPSFTNTGTVTVPVLRTWTVTGGTVTNATSGVFIGGTASSSSSGTYDFIAGTYVNNGTTSPGGVGGTGRYNHTGPITFGSNAVVDIEIRGTTQGSFYDVLFMNGTATLGGTLNVSFINGFTPAPGATFNVVQYPGTPLGAFATTNLPAGCFGSANSGAYVITCP